MKPYIVGIAGGSASGKSTFTEKLIKRLSDMRLRTTVFHMDAYFKPPEQLPTAVAPITGINYKDHNHPLTADLPKLAADLTTAIEGDDPTQNHEAKISNNVIIVEGLLTLWDEAILRLLDLKLFIDCRPDERIVRRLRRNMHQPDVVIFCNDECYRLDFDAGAYASGE